MPRLSWPSLLLLTSLWLACRVPAYEPPLQNVTTSIETNGYSFDLRFTVMDPDLQQNRSGLKRYSGSAGDFWRLTDLGTSGGVVVWRVDRDGLSVPPDTEVGCAVYDPALQVWKTGTWRYDGSVLQRWETFNLTSSGAMVAWWAVMGGTGSFRDSEIAYAAYDPGLGRWVKEERFFEGSTLHFQQPSSLRLNGRTVAWKADPFGTSAVFDRQVGYATYDAAARFWVEAERGYNGTSLQYWVTSGLVVQDGIAAWKAESSGMLSSFDVEVSFALYDPVRRGWQRGARDYDGRENDQWLVSAPMINGQQVSWTTEQGGNVVTERHGFDHPTRTWPSAPTSVVAALGMSLDQGAPPLGVWFCDLSLGATNWSWTFGDGSTSSARQPYHRYDSPGIYRVTLQTTGPAGTNQVSYLVTADSASTSLLFVADSLSDTGMTFRVWLTGVPDGGKVVIENSTNLVDWMPVLTNATGQSTIEVALPWMDGAAGQFFRATLP